MARKRESERRHQELVRAQRAAEEEWNRMGVQWREEPADTEGIRRAQQALRRQGFVNPWDYQGEV